MPLGGSAGGSANSMVGMFLIGIAIGLYLPKFPQPLDLLNTYFGLVLIIIAIILLVKS
ncbi:MAG: hypothetical protein WC602_00915 [archaeon]